MAEPRRCSRCILPDTFPGADLGEEGVCRPCASHVPTSVHGEGALHDAVGTARGPVYDCVVPLSGGKDSSYVLLYAVERLKLRPVRVCAHPLSRHVSRARACWPRTSRDTA